MRDTKIFRISEMYWMTKALIAQIVKERSLQQQVILHKIDFLDSKFEPVFKAVYGVDIVVSQPQHGNNDTMEMKEDSPGSVGTQSNPTCIEEDPMPLTATRNGPLQTCEPDGSQLEKASFILLFSTGLSLLYLVFMVCYRLLVNTVISFCTRNYRMISNNVHDCYGSIFSAGSGPGFPSGRPQPGMAVIFCI